jgi:hypothetical protein
VNLRASLVLFIVVNLWSVHLEIFIVFYRTRATEGQLCAGDGAGTMALLLQLHLCLFGGVPKETSFYTFGALPLGS